MNGLWKNHIECSLSHLEQQQLLRLRGSNWHSENGCTNWLDFGSNDYLALSRSSQILEALDQADQPVWGSGASPVLSGYGLCHRQLELSLAKLSGMQSAMVFSSGYAGNVGTLAALADDDCIVFSDQLNHASLIDGMRLGRSLRVVYPHKDVETLRRLLTESRNHRTRALIVTESVFSMDGDEAPLEQLVDLAEQFGCGLIVDEAHAVGVWGSGGGGLLEELNLSDRVLLKLGTLSKALGGIGGYAAGDRRTIEFLVNRCRSYVFSTAIPARVAKAAQIAVDCLPAMQPQRQQLANLASYARRQLSQHGWQTLPGRSPILPIIVGEAATALALSRHLLSQGIYVPAIRPPTVPEGTCRLRISLSIKHTPSDIDRLTSTLK